MKIAILNKSTLVSNAEVRTMTTAISQQAKDAAKLWELLAPTTKFFADEASVPADYNKVFIFDDADVAGALGYHDDGPDGKPYGRIFARVSLDNGVSVSSVLSHEVLEMLGDPQANYWADNFNDNKSYALELCDPVENDSYTILVRGKPVEVSNFVLPAWFDSVPVEGAKFDKLGKLTAPFKMTTGGYVIVRAQGKVSQTFGETFPEWKKALKLEKLGSRTGRRSKRGNC